MRELAFSWAPAATRMGLGLKKLTSCCFLSEPPGLTLSLSILDNYTMVTLHRWAL